MNFKNWAFWSGGWHKQKWCGRAKNIVLYKSSSGRARTEDQHGVHLLWHDEYVVLCSLTSVFFNFEVRWTSSCISVVRGELGSCHDIRGSWSSKWGNVDFFRAHWAQHFLNWYFIENHQPLVHWLSWSCFDRGLLSWSGGQELRYRYGWNTRIRWICTHAIGMGRCAETIKREMLWYLTNMFSFPFTKDYYIAAWATGPGSEPLKSSTENKELPRTGRRRVQIELLLNNFWKCKTLWGPSFTHSLCYPSASISSSLRLEEIKRSLEPLGAVLGSYNGT